MWGVIVHYVYQQHRRTAHKPIQRNSTLRSRTSQSGYYIFVIIHNRNLREQLGHYGEGV